MMWSVRPSGMRCCRRCCPKPDLAMKLLYVMRHGESIVNRERRLTCRRLEGDLSDRGREQSSLAAEWLRDVGITSIRHSPFHRAYQTAQIVADQLQLPLAVDDDLREMDCGDLEWRTDREAWETWQQVYDRWMARDWEAAFPGGETYQHAFDRFTRALVRVPAGETPLLVTHGGVSTTIIPYVCVNAAALQGDRSLSNTGLVVLEPYGDGRFICRSWNLTEHLDARPL